MNPANPATPTLTLHRADHGSHFRAYGLRGVAAHIDPFLGVDHAWMSAPTFPPHPHAGFSAVSYLFLDSETGIHNRDSIGHRNLIRPGGLHWTTAGRGIVHEEVPAQTGQTVHMLQIFVNLAPQDQGMAPAAMSLEPQDVPVVRSPGATVRVPFGRFGDTRSPLDTPTQATLLDITLEPGAELQVPIPAGQSAFVMPIAGTVLVDGQRYALDDLQLPLWAAQTAARTLTLSAPRGDEQGSEQGTEKGATHVALFAGTPLRSRAS